MIDAFGNLVHWTNHHWILTAIICGVVKFFYNEWRDSHDPAPPEQRFSMPPREEA